MTILNCEYRRDSTNVALIMSFILGIITAFLQITAVITVTPVFFLVALGIAIVYLAVTLIAVALAQGAASCRDVCQTLSGLLLGILGTILLSIILFVVGFAATSIIGAIFLGALVFFFSLMLTTTACLAKCLLCCEN